MNASMLQLLSFGLGLATEVASAIHLIQGGSSPAPTAADPFNGLPGLPGHPVLNALSALISVPATPSAPAAGS